MLDVIFITNITAAHIYYKNTISTNENCEIAEIIELFF